MLWGGEAARGPPERGRVGVPAGRRACGGRGRGWRSPEQPWGRLRGRLTGRGVGVHGAGGWAGRNNEEPPQEAAQKKGFYVMFFRGKVAQVVVSGFYGL